MEELCRAPPWRLLVQPSALQSSSMEVARTALRDTPAELRDKTAQFAGCRHEVSRAVAKVAVRTLFEFSADKSVDDPGIKRDTGTGSLEHRSSIACKVHLQLKNTERAVACAALKTAFQNMDPEKEVFLSSEQTVLISFTEHQHSKAGSKSVRFAALALPFDAVVTSCKSAADGNICLPQAPNRGAYFNRDAYFIRDFTEGERDMDWKNGGRATEKFFGDCSLNSPSALRQNKSLRWLASPFSFAFTSLRSALKTSQFVMAGDTELSVCHRLTDGELSEQSCAELQRKEVKAKLNGDANQRIDFIWRRALRVSQTDGELSEHCAELQRKEVKVKLNGDANQRIDFFRRGALRGYRGGLHEQPPWRSSAELLHGGCSVAGWLQVRATKIILGNTFHSYSAACEALQLQKLEDRRVSLCLKFAQKLYKSEQEFRDLIPP
ncbi:hypothetical protein Bbelb_427750 [Branchiostoma belcheri]|nr:hypothetical protein Bbelb_427750 [Branchiostoma belcheri]